MSKIKPPSSKSKVLRSGRTRPVHENLGIEPTFRRFNTKVTITFSTGGPDRISDFCISIHPSDFKKLRSLMDDAETSHLNSLERRISKLEARP